MKVICINNSKHTNELSKTWEAPELTEGMVYTIIREEEFGYHLKEVSCWSPAGWNKNRFIRCSDIDEMELLQKEIFNPTNQE